LKPTKLSRIFQYLYWQIQRRIGMTSEAAC
jgi:hypothetical protein